jgi:energy-coupling factor transporter ATP-binding protein EcfA2
MSEPLLELERVSYRYPGGGRPALDQVSLTVGPGELVVVAGGSGSGKSTLLRTACGLVPHFYGGEFAGRAAAGGLGTREHGPGELAAVVGTLFQDPETQVVMGTVAAELAFALENAGRSPAAVARAVQETALALGIDHLLERSTAELSGGERQRVALAATLAGAPALVVLDEPTSQLDPVAGDELIGLLRRLNEDLDTAIVLAEHRLERCLPAADRVIALDGGRIVCDAPPSEFLAWALAAAPELATPGARLLAGLGLRPGAGVKRARAALRRAGLLPGPPRAPAPSAAPPAGRPPSSPLALRAPAAGAPTGGNDRSGWLGPRRRRRERANAGDAEGPALELVRVWCELREGPVALRDLSLTVARGERIALMGRNGAGKSTLLRVAAGLSEPTRGRVRRAGRVALLLQNPSSYLVHERVSDEASEGALRAAGLDPSSFASRHPRDLSGGERQRLALAIVLDGDQPPAVVCLDEPTRGMDRAARERLLEWLERVEAAVILATHDPELAAAFARRVVLLGEGGVIADGPVAELLAGGIYFATETARILGGQAGALLPHEGVALLGRAPAPAPEVALP